MHFTSALPCYAISNDTRGKVNYLYSVYHGHTPFLREVRLLYRCSRVVYRKQQLRAGKSYTHTHIQSRLACTRMVVRLFSSSDRAVFFRYVSLRIHGNTWCVRGMYAFGETIIRAFSRSRFTRWSFRPNDQVKRDVLPDIYSICRPMRANLLITSDLRLFPLHILYIHDVIRISHEYISVRRDVLVFQSSKLPRANIICRRFSLMNAYTRI